MRHFPGPQKNLEGLPKRCIQLPTTFERKDVQTVSETRFVSGHAPEMVETLPAQSLWST